MKISHLLINEPPLQVSPTLAAQVGLNEAIVLQQVHYWLVNPKCQGVIDEDGNKWIYNSYEEWQEGNFPFWSVPTIQRVFLSLENTGMLLSAQFWAHKRDMRKFYRIHYERLDSLDDIKLMPSERIKLMPSMTSKRCDVKEESETTASTNKSLSADAPNFKKMTLPEAYKLPTLRMYRDATNFFPGQAVWEYVHNFILENNITSSALENAFKEWKLSGFKSENVRGILEWARDGVPTMKPTNTKTKSGKDSSKVMNGTVNFLKRHGSENPNGDTA